MNGSNRNIHKIISFLLALALAITPLFSHESVYAKGKAKVTFSKKTATVTVGKTVKIKVKCKKKYKKLKVKASKKNRVKVSVKGKKLVIKGRKAGNVKLTVKAYNKKGKLVAKGNLSVKVKKKKAKTSSSEKKNTQKKDTEKKDSDKKNQDNTDKNKTTDKDSSDDKKNTEDKNTDTDKNSDKNSDTNKDNKDNSSEKTSEQDGGGQQGTSEEKNTGEKTSEEQNTGEQTSEEQNTGDKQPSAETVNYDAGDYSISKTHKGEGTFYTRTSTGAANLDDYEKTYYTAAMNETDYTAGKLAGAYVEIIDKDGDKVKVLITDILPSKDSNGNVEGKQGDIDLCPAAFKSIEDENTGRMNITWKIIPLPTEDPISFKWKKESTKWWSEVQIRNTRYPVAKVEYYNTAAGKYKELTWKSYNYFATPKYEGMGDGPYTFRITDIYGHQIIEKNISMNTDETLVKGSGNFPY